MFIEFVDYDGQPTMIQSRHIMAYWASEEQKVMDPPQVNFMMQCGTGSEVWLIQDTLDSVKAKLWGHWGIEPDDYNGSGNGQLRGKVSDHVPVSKSR